MTLKDTIDKLEELKKELLNSLKSKENKDIKISYENTIGKGNNIIKNGYYYVPIKIEFIYNYKEVVDDTVILDRYSSVIHDFYHFINMIPHKIRDEFENQLSVDRNIYYDRIYISSILNIKVN